MNRSHGTSTKPAGIKLLGLLSLLVGVPVTLGLGYLLPEYGPGFFPMEGTSRGDLAGRGLALATLSGLVAGVLITAAGVVLLFARSSRSTMARRLMSGAVGAALAMGGFALGGGLLGQSKGGLKEATLIVGALPFAVVLLLLALAGVWYLRRDAARREPD